MKSKWWLELRAQHADAPTPDHYLLQSGATGAKERLYLWAKNKDPLVENIWHITLYCQQHAAVCTLHRCMPRRKTKHCFTWKCWKFGPVFFNFRVFLLRYLAKILRNSEFEQLVTATCVDIYLRIVISKHVTNVWQSKSKLADCLQNIDCKFKYINRHFQSSMHAPSLSIPKPNISNMSGYQVSMVSSHKK